MLLELFFEGSTAFPPRIPGTASTVEDVLDAGGFEALCAALRSAPNSAGVQVRSLPVMSDAGCRAWRTARVAPDLGRATTQQRWDLGC